MNDDRTPLGRRGRLERDERGAVLVLFALLLIVLLGMVALAVDIGLLMTARTESQRVADASALAGAGWLLAAPQDEAGARAEAIRFADMHEIRRETASVLPEDVEVFLGPQRVRVTVHNTQERGNAIPTIFGRILGHQRFNVASVAMAEAAQAGNPFCDLPLAIIDKCETEDGNCLEEPYPYDPEGAPHYDLGEKVELKLSQNPDQTPPACEDTGLFDACDVFEDGSWHCWFLPYPEPLDDDRNEDLRRRILGECPDGELISQGDTVYSTPGQAQALAEEMAEFIDMYPNEYWNPDKSCVADSPTGNCLADPKRVRSVPVVRPDEVWGTGNEKQGTIIEWAGVFMEKVACSDNLDHRGGPKGHWNLYTRFVPAPGQNPSGPTSSDPTLRVLRLVE